MIPREELDPELGRLHLVGRPAQAVWFVLVSFANHRTGLACPSHETVAGSLGCTVKTVERAVGELEQHGMIELIRRGGGRKRSGKGITNKYLITPPNPDNSVGVAEVPTPTVLTGNPDNSVPNTPTKVSEEQGIEQFKEQGASARDLPTDSGSGSPAARPYTPPGYTRCPTRGCLVKITEREVSVQPETTHA